MHETFRTNNFDTLRLLAALQVVIVHGLDHFELAAPAFIRTALSLFPGVPIFFFISGFLITASLVRSPSLGYYFQNRFLRIFPGLWFSFAISLVILFIFDQLVYNSQLLIWIITQTTFMQFYNPDFLRGFGVGVVNGSLWTIPVELQFYLFLPFLFFVIAKLKNKNCFYFIALVFFVLLIAFNLINYSKGMSERALIEKLFSVSLLPHLYMFLFGALFYRYFKQIHSFLANRFSFVVLAYAAVSYLAYSFNLRPAGNAINPVSYLFLAAVVFTFAYSWGGVADKLLKGNDISYSAYIYHMLVINIMLELGYLGSYSHLFFMIAIVLVLALVSWRLIEKPALALKKYSFKRN